MTTDSTGLVGLRPGESAPEPGPVLSFAERDRRWAGLRAIMGKRGIDAIVVGSFQGRERLESYLIDDFFDAVVVLPRAGEVTVLAFGASRVSRVFESARRGIPAWVSDYRIGGGGAKVAAILEEKGVAGGVIGVVGFGPTAPGEAEGLLPLGFHRNLVAALPRARIEDFTQDLTDFMLVKGPEEIACLRYAARVSESACKTIMAFSRPGVSEALVFAEVLREIHRHGCDVRYPFLSMQSGPDNIAWGVPRWSIRAEPPRTLARGDLVQAEIHTLYGGQEAQVQMAVAIDPVDAEIRRCAEVARTSYETGLAAVRPGRTFADVVAAMAAPIAESGCWSKTPLLHTITFGATGFTPANREQLRGTREEALEYHQRPGVRRGDIVLREGMALELEPNACIGMKRVNIGTAVLVTATGAEPLNELPTALRYV